MKIAINKCYGCFGVSEAIYKELGLKWDDFGYLNNEMLGIESSNCNEWRKSHKLIKAIEKIGEDDASGKLAKIRIIDIPDNIKWEIYNSDGMETIHEAHRSWF